MFRLPCLSSVGWLMHSRTIGALLRMARSHDRGALRALRAETRARSLARLAALKDHAAGGGLAPSPAQRRQLTRAQLTAARLARQVSKPTIVPIDMRARGGQMIQTEAERRFEIDNMMADARLEGHEFSDERKALFERYVRAEITSDELTVQWRAQSEALIEAHERGLV